MYASFRPEKHPNSARSNCFERISDTTNSWVPKGIIHLRTKNGLRSDLDESWGYWGYMNDMQQTWE